MGKKNDEERQSGKLKHGNEVRENKKWYGMHLSGENGIRKSRTKKEGTCHAHNASDFDFFCWIGYNISRIMG